MTVRFTIAAATVLLCCGSVSAQFGGGSRIPSGPSYTPPSYTPPSPPRYTPPSRPSYTPPSYTPPSTPSYTPPSYTPPEMPRYEPPEIPSYEPPTYTPPEMPSYDTSIPDYSSSIPDYSSSVPSYEYTTDKQCMSCNRTVSSSSKVGDTCPHCGIRWTSEEDQFGHTTSGSGSSAYNAGRLVGLGVGGLVGLIALVGGIVAAVSRSGKSKSYPATQQNAWSQQQQQQGYGQPQQSAWQQQQNALHNQQQAPTEQQSGNFFSDWHQ